MSARQLAVLDSGPALFAYLNQDHADPEVCRLDARGPHLSALTQGVVSALAEALAHVPTPPWQACVLALLQTADPQGSAQLLDELGERYRSLLTDPELETSHAEQDQLEALQAVYLERPHETASTPDVSDALFDELRVALRERQLGAVATRFGEHLLRAFDLEHDRWQDQPVTSEVIAQLHAAQNEHALHMFAMRLQSDALRTESRRMLVRLHITATRDPDLTEHSAEIESTVLARGDNAVQLSPDALRSAELRNVPWSTVLVSQDLNQQLATLEVQGQSMQLREVLFVQQTEARAITLCAPAQALDPRPCIPLAAVTLDSHFAHLDRTGTLHFAHDLALAELLPVVQQGGQLVLPLRVQEAEIAGTTWPLHFAVPEPFIFAGDAHGESGPDLRISVVCAERDLLSFAITGVAGQQNAVLEAADLAHFSIVSRGAKGAAGMAGMAGSTGTTGAECQNGGPGGDGARGGNGGPGGNGGHITVEVSCGVGADASAREAVLLPLFRAAIRSEAGPGGELGHGGAPGPGGAGGDARADVTHTDANGQVTVDRAGCGRGLTGIFGARGLDGRPGSAGTPGLVDITFH